MLWVATSWVGILQAAEVVHPAHDDETVMNGAPELCPDGAPYVSENLNAKEAV